MVTSYVSHQVSCAPFTINFPVSMQSGDVTSGHAKGSRAYPLLIVSQVSRSTIHSSIASRRSMKLARHPFSIHDIASHPGFSYGNIPMAVSTVSLFRRISKRFGCLCSSCFPSASHRRTPGFSENLAMHAARTGHDRPTALTGRRVISSVLRDSWPETMRPM